MNKNTLIALLLLASSVNAPLLSPAVWGQQSQAPVAVDGDLEIIKTRLLASQIVTDPQALQNLARDVTALLGSMGADGKWPGLVYADTGPGEWGPSQHLDKVLVMTRAYATPGQPLHANAALLEKINLGLDTFFAGNYLNANWWYNDIGVPLKIGSILLLLEDTISPARKEQGLALLKRSADDKPMRKSTGANLSWLARIQLMRGLALPSPSLVNDSLDAMWSEIKITPQQTDGIQADYSFHQHGPLPYNGGYGTSFMNYATDFHSYARGTRFAMPPEKERLLINFLLDGQDWLSRGNDFDPGVRGRVITRPREEGGSNWRRIAAVWAQSGANWRQSELLEMAQRSDANGKKRVGNRHFWNSDMMTQHREGYYTSVRMYSTRTRNTDGASKEGGPINHEGRLSHHIADGATFIVRRGDEYEGIFPLWNWNLIPGTTAEQVDVVALEASRVAFKGTESYVGGVSDGMYGVAAMNLARGGLSAKKAWFYFDDEFVALGAGIRATSDNAVCTSVNQSLLHGDVRVSNAVTPLSQGQRTQSNTRWVLHDETGYLFPAGTTLQLSNQTQNGRWSDIGTGSDAVVSRGVFNLYLNHGTKPADASYEYIVVPNTNALALNARVANSSVETLSNTPDLQAVRHNGLKILQAVFRRAGTLNGGAGWNLTVDAPCLVMVREVTEGVKVTVSNPENKPLAVNLEINRRLEGEGATAQDNGSKIRFDLPDGLMAGSSVSRVFKRK